MPQGKVEKIEETGSQQRNQISNSIFHPLYEADLSIDLGLVDLITYTVTPCTVLLVNQLSLPSSSDLFRPNGPECDVIKMTNNHFYLFNMNQGVLLID
jgi:hypothetical protein